MNKKLPVLTILCIAVAVGLAAWHGLFIKTGEQATEDIVETKQPEEIAENENHIYRNEEWGFQSEYPKRWNLQDPVSSNKAALLNIGLIDDEKLAFSPLRIFISSKEWGERLRKKFESKIVIGGREWWSYSSVTMSSIPTQEYFVLINDEYWINLSVQDEYASELQLVLNTFKFIE